MAGIARAGGVSRAFLYRHPDLLDRVRTAETTPTRPAAAPHEVSRASLLADLSNARAAAAVSRRGSGIWTAGSPSCSASRPWVESGLDAPDDVDQLRRQLRGFEEPVSDLTAELDERTQDLNAARATNRDLLTRLNTAGTTRR